MSPDFHKIHPNGYGKLIAAILSLCLVAAIGVFDLFFLAIVTSKLTMGWDLFIRELPSYIQKIKQIAMEWKSRLPDHYGFYEIERLIDWVSYNIGVSAQRTVFIVYPFAGRFSRHF